MSKSLIPMRLRIVKLPPKEWLDNLFEYRPEEGLFWKLRPLKHFKAEVDWYIWNKRFARKMAGSRVRRKAKSGTIFNDHSRVQIPIAGGGMLKTFSVHRVIYAMLEITIPDGKIIDHINGNAWDNRKVNLRIASHRQNMHNNKGWGDRRKHKLPKGVYIQPNRKTNPFYSMLKVNGKYERIGGFPTIEAAREAYCKRAVEVHGPFVNLG